MMNSIRWQPLARIVSCAVFMMAFSICVFADSSALIISGVPGDPEHTEKFNKWTETTRKLLVEKFGFTADRVIVLSDKATAKPEILKAFDQLKTQLKPSDTFFLFMIGHGSYDTDYKFNIMGPDMTGMEYSQLLNTLKVARIVIVNGTSASGGALETMAGKNRIIVTATRAATKATNRSFTSTLSRLWRVPRRMKTRTARFRSGKHSNLPRIPLTGFIKKRIVWPPNIRSFPTALPRPLTTKRRNLQRWLASPRFRWTGRGPFQIPNCRDC